ncbi:hypothetical protein CAPTEDRAFT_189459 [Capitella teleta]|uniref:Uncharacterized protein n=1 Tax=Capitella teleta TaxID=283909 RepID=R7V0F6_CAPTE|nr:hypothetical protein CAPTEDRAFT_189459 [Capitella teleta]|eukprot:ELU12318.1 hypothetical protein CAPTEDRAFT_189459 [Capitella teleta]
MQKGDYKYCLVGTTIAAFIISSISIFLLPSWKDPFAKNAIKFDNTPVHTKRRDSTMKIEHKPCTFSNFQHAMYSEGYFPGKGRWVLPSNGFQGFNFLPSFCYLERHTPLPVARCFGRRNWSRILTLGDSTGRKHFAALVTILEGNGYTCTLLRAEGGEYLPDTSYFEGTHQVGTLIKEPRSCNACGGVRYNCIKDNSTIHVEHLGLASWKDTSLQIPPRFNTTLEFYFKVYLKDNPPDVIVLGLPFLQEKTQPVERNTQQLNKFISKMTQLVPLTTTMFWLPAGAESTQNNCSVTNNVNKQIVAVNRALFDRLGSRFLNTSDAWFGFYDEHALSCSAQPMWKDAESLGSAFYDVLVHLLLALFCA